MTKIIRTATVALSLDYLLKGQLKFLNQHYKVVAVSGFDAHLQTVEKREQIRTVPVTMQRSIKPFQDIICLWKLYRLFIKEQPQIVHSITPKAGLLSMLAAKMAGVPVRIHTFTGLIFPSKNGILKQLLILMDKLLCWSATNIYPEGNGVKNDLIQYRITAKPLNVLANGNVNGIDINYFSLDSMNTKMKEELKVKLKIKPTDFVFIFVGRLVGDKGINELISAFTNIKALNAKLILVGSFEQELDPLEKSTLTEIEGNHNIIPVGFQSDVRPYLSISNCLAFPSYREGFPNVVLQAGAMGLPCIVTDINGSNEIIIDGVNGKIIPPKNKIALENAMLKMMEDVVWCNHLQTNARNLILSRYSQEIVWDAILREYKRLLNYV